MNKELELEAEEYANIKCEMNVLKKHTKNTFIAGATSKYVEKQKLEFAIEHLKELTEKIGGYSFKDVDNKLQELEQKLSEL